MPLLIDQLCECGHTRAAHYSVNEQTALGCMEPRCCVAFKAKGPPPPIVDRKSPPVKVKFED